MKVAVLGFGTVGKGVWDMLAKADGIEQGKVLVRPGKVDTEYKVDSIEDIINDPEIDAVAEVMGGVEPAFEYVAAALSAGKHAVTSNKALVAAKGPELAKIAEENGVGFLFSAACGGGVPFLHNLALAAESDSIISLGGILNGTTNYMLDAMQSRNMSYEAALADAQTLGYAEADPTADVSGLDALRKIMLACGVAYNRLPVEGLTREGIESITDSDVADLKSRGLCCRLLCSGGMDEHGGLYANIEPVVLPLSAVECSVLRNFNMAKYLGKCSGSISMIGQGAGRWPTASAVLRDLNDIASGRRKMMSGSCKRVTADNNLCNHSYYVRLSADNACLLKMKEAKESGGIVRGITESMSVNEMHSFANKIREQGGEIFFAAIGEQE